ncbi:glycosyltransferase family 2 protein [Myxococcota bacterium]|nr:glycosyltransferase family 2 protein [Myxococcota bacterium]MBU1430932.1 glycosyltransferase family 2 protein [Myxococcota bacterium]MBU1900713.1 glycosyltransferase family 2 protein [Myxococcota bacterium]
MSSPEIPPARPEISVVIPLFNEEESLRPLHARLTEVLAARGAPYEILFINDGSGDKSGEIIDALAEEDACVGVIHFRRNFGKAAGLDAGFRAARGRFVFTMDADLQDDPKEIPRFLDKLDEGFDVVSGWKQKRHDPLDKTLPSKVFNFVVSRVSGLTLNDFNCGFKAYRAEALSQLNLYGELHRYVPVLLHWQGFRVGEMVVEHHPRKFGVSKYGVERMAKGFFDLLTVLLNTRYRTRPLHLFGFTGLLFGVSGFLILSYLSLLWFLGMGPIGGRPLLFLGVLLVIFGGQLISTGLLGELINRGQQSDHRAYVIRAHRAPRGGDDA